MEFIRRVFGQPKRTFGVGDLAPDSLLAHKDGDGNLGAFITIDPQTRRITAIWAP